jgi:hypothetical protein
MIIKLLCSLEAYHTPLLWSTTALVSNVPLYLYSLVLLFDFFLYYFIALFFAWHQFRLEEKLFLRSTQQPIPPPPHHRPSLFSSQSFRARNWFNFTKLGIPFRFQIPSSSTQSYSQIPDQEDEDVEALSHTRGSNSEWRSIALKISSLCKSYETIDGSPIEVLKNVSGELKRGSITTLLGR